MDKWVLLEHEVYNSKSKDIHFDFLIENGIDCLTWKFLKLPLLNQASIEISKQPNHRLIWLSRLEHELSDNRGFAIAGAGSLLFIALRFVPDAGN